VQWGADKRNAFEIGGAASAVATYVGAQGQATVSVIANAAKNPVVLLGAADLALGWGVLNEAVAAYQGECH
jgi:hypothetical protein